MTLKILAAASLLSLSSLAIAQDGPIQGKVTAVEGNKVTVEVQAGEAEKLKVGGEIEVKVKAQKEAPKKTGGALQGC